MVTYNHEKYIFKSLQSIINCNFNFEFEIIIGNDKSIDNTRNEIERFKNNYPDVEIRAIHREENLGATQNYLDVLSLAKGNYILCLDGDDYLEIGGNFVDIGNLLDTANGCLIFSYRILNDKMGNFRSIPVKEISLEKSLDGLFLHLGSIFVPRRIILQLLSYHWLNNYNFLDRPLQIDIARSQNSRFFPETFLSVYRLHSESLSSSMSNIVVLNKVTEFVIEYFGHNKVEMKSQERLIFKKRISENYILLCHPLHVPGVSGLFKKLQQKFKWFVKNTSLYFTLVLYVRCVSIFTFKKIYFSFR